MEIRKYNEEVVKCNWYYHRKAEKALSSIISSWKNVKINQGTFFLRNKQDRKEIKGY
jgi:hypothetical protein